MGLAAALTTASYLASSARIADSTSASMASALFVEEASFAIALGCFLAYFANRQQSQAESVLESKIVLLRIPSSTSSAESTTG